MGTRWSEEQKRTSTLLRLCLGWAESWEFSRSLAREPINACRSQCAQTRKLCMPTSHVSHARTRNWSCLCEAEIHNGINTRTKKQNKKRKLYMPHLHGHDIGEFFFWGRDVCRYQCTHAWIVYTYTPIVCTWHGQTGHSFEAEVYVGINAHTRKPCTHY